MSKIITRDRQTGVTSSSESKHGHIIAINNAEIGQQNPSYQDSIMIQEMEIELKRMEEDFMNKRKLVEEDLGEDCFKIVCPDIDTMPEKYISASGKKIRPLAELGLRKKTLRQELEEKKKLATITIPKLVGDVRLIKNKTKELQNQKNEIKTKICKLSDDINDLKEKTEFKNIMQLNDNFERCTREINTIKSNYEIFSQNLKSTNGMNKCTTKNNLKNEQDRLLERYTQLKENIKNLIGDEPFQMICPDIDIAPEKYLNQKAEIKTLAELGVEIKLKQEQKSLDISISQIIEELLLQIKNSYKLIEINATLEAKVNSLEKENKDLGEQLRLKQKIIDEEYIKKQVLSTDRMTIDQLTEEIYIFKQELNQYEDEMNKRKRIFENRIRSFEYVKNISSEHTNHIQSLTSSPNGKYMISGATDNSIKIWKDIKFESKEKNISDDLPLFICDKTLIEHSNIVCCVKCAYLDTQNKSDVIFISGSADQTLKMWNVDTGECKWTGREHSDTVWDVTISTECNDNEHALIASVGNKDKTIKIWDPKQNNNTEIYSIKTIYDTFNKTSDSVVFYSNNNDKLMAIGNDKEGNNNKSVIKLFDIEKGVRISTMKKKHNAEPRIIIPSTYYNYAISCSFQDPTIIIHDIRSTDEVRQIPHHSAGINDIKLFNNDYLISSSTDKTLKVTNIIDGRCLTSLRHSFGIGASIIDGIHGKYILCAEWNSHNLKVWSD